MCAMEPFDSTKPVFESPLVSSEVRNNLLALHNGDLFPLRPRASDPLAMTVYVNPTLIEDYWMQVWQGIQAPLEFAGDDSPIVSAPAGNSRIDLLTIDSTGTLAWIEGEEAAGPTPPDCPEEVIPICYIYCKTTMVKIVNFEDATTYPNDGYIYQDIRPFINLGGLVVSPITNFQSYKKEFAGDASDGDVTISDDTVLPDSGVGVKVMEYDTLTIDAGKYLAGHANDKMLVLLCKTLNLNGQIYMTDRGGLGGAGRSSAGAGNPGGAGAFGGGGGGGPGSNYRGGGGGGGGQPGDTVASGTGFGGGKFANISQPPSNPFSLGVGYGGDANYQTAYPGVKTMANPLTPLIFEIARYLYGAGGGGGGRDASGTSGAGGRGGGVVWIEADTIIWGGSGLITANGSNGAGPSVGGGSGGGGGGGFIQIVYKNKTGSSTLQVNKGNSGGVAYDGGNGADGLTGEFQTE